jgi:endonuclease/exonuclease/phosphatase family metal-dependent hydrolase
VKVLTLNTWQKCGPWVERWEVLFDGIAEYQPDVLAFQELFDPAWRDTVAKRAGYPYCADPTPISSGLVVLSRLPVLASELYALSAQSPLEDYRRYVLWAEIALGERTLHVFNAHLSWHPDDEATRKAQVRELRHRMSQQNGSNRLLMGDMNATPDSNEIRWLLTESDLVDTFAAKNPADSGITWDTQNRYTSQQKPHTLDRRIDYIFCAGDEPVRSLSSCRVVFNRPDRNGIFASDHYGILAEFFPTSRNGKKALDQEEIRRRWAARGFSCDLWVDPPGRVWSDFVHETDELVMIVEGEQEFEMNGRSHRPPIGEELLIPAGTSHTARNFGRITSRWLYGYKS